MNTTAQNLCAAWAALLLVACGSTGQKTASISFSARGGGSEPFMANGWQVALEEAEVGFGPIYFCAAKGSSADLCPTAVAEFASSATIDGIDASAQPLDAMRGVTGNIHSVAWDYAITWPTTRSNPVVLDAAPQGHSAHFSGRAEKDGAVIRFVADVDVKPLLQGTHAVQGVRTDAVVTSDGTACQLVIDPAAWWSRVDFDDFEVSEEPISITEETSAYQALVFAMTSNELPTFHWSEQ